MRELSLHILDIAENGINAGADSIEIDIQADSRQNTLKIKINDNGRGIPDHIKAQISDPFVTTRTTRRVGLGLSLLKEAALRCEGGFDIISGENKGTSVTACFKLDHIDRAPLGNLTLSLITLIAGHPAIDFKLTYQADNDTFSFDTEETRNELDGLSISDPVVTHHLKKLIEKELSAFALKI